MSETPELHELEAALASPLRIRLVADLIDAAGGSITLDEAVQRTGRHRQDVVACLEPLVHWGVVAWDAAGRACHLRNDGPEPVLAALRQAVVAGAEALDRERRIRATVLCGMIGVDAKMLMVFEMIQQVARLDVPVLITGETGTGKELVARAIHELGHARDHHFGAVNCATLTEELFASEMFGHRRGAFTGALRNHTGLLERCHHGTLLLDEVGDLSVPNQVKLLRVLQERTFVRVGGERQRSSDFRIICATNRDLEDLVGTGDFREDLYYRLNVFPLRVPSLRERPDDLPHLVRELLRAKLRAYHRGTEPARLSHAALTALRRHAWPGNVRELENVLMRALVLAGGGPIGPEHLPALRDSGRRTTTRPGELVTLSEVERRHIARVVRAMEGNISASAATLGISRTTLYKKLRDHDLAIERLVSR